jgi:hypothetical protein
LEESFYKNCRAEVSRIVVGNRKVRERRGR